MGLLWVIRIMKVSRVNHEFICGYYWVSMRLLLDNYFIMGLLWVYYKVTMIMRLWDYCEVIMGLLRGYYEVIMRLL